MTAKPKPTPLQARIISYCGARLPPWRNTHPRPGDAWAHETVNIMLAGWLPTDHFRFLTHCKVHKPKGKQWGNTPLAKLLQMTQDTLCKAFSIKYTGPQTEQHFVLTDEALVKPFVKQENRSMSNTATETDDTIEVSTPKRRGSSKKKVASKKGFGAKKKAVARKKAPARMAKKKITKKNQPAPPPADEGGGSRKKRAAKKKAARSGGGGGGGKAGVLGPIGGAKDWEEFDTWLKKSVKPNPDESDRMLVPREGSLPAEAAALVPNRGMKVAKLVATIESELGSPERQARHLTYRLINTRMIVAK